MQTITQGDESAANNHGTDLTVAVANLAARINEAHAHAIEHAEKAIDEARRAGELLIEAKAQLGHGGWLPWLAANCKFGERQAQRYIQLASNWTSLASNPTRVSDLSLRGALAQLSKAKPHCTSANVPAQTERAPAALIGHALQSQNGVERTSDTTKATDPTTAEATKAKPGSKDAPDQQTEHIKKLAEEYGSLARRLRDACITSKTLSRELVNDIDEVVWIAKFAKNIERDLGLSNRKGACAEPCDRTTRQRLRAARGGAHEARP